ncbi:MAG: cobalamin biosynthesis protein [Magnetococcales bacterium]|nr:cobalamin biosynthesis protein [Magnetococcales bacterium]
MEMVTTQTAAALLLALLLDGWIGEPRRWHPLVGFGRLADWLESRLNPQEGTPGRLAARGAGCAAWGVLVLLPAGLLAWGLPQDGSFWLVEAVLLYLTVGGRSLIEHGEAVRAALARQDRELARVRVGYLVSRETAALEPAQVAGATIESLLENGCDALFGAMFWFLVAGAPGALAYRLANTLDAMWGYKTPRLLHFGWAAARADDLLNLVPARLTALSYTLAGRTATAWRCWNRQGGGWKSPNAGVVMASGAGALGLRLGGPARYHGIDTMRPQLGEGDPPDGEDIARAIGLLRRALLLWGLAVMTAWGIGHA